MWSDSKEMELCKAEPGGAATSVKGELENSSPPCLVKTEGHLSLLRGLGPRVELAVKRFMTGWGDRKYASKLSSTTCQGTRNQDVTHLEQVGSFQTVIKAVKLSLSRSIATVPHVAI